MMNRGKGGSILGRREAAGGKRVLCDSETLQENRGVRIGRKALSFMLLILLLSGFFLYGEVVYGNSNQTVSGEQAISIANQLEDLEAKAAILEAVRKGAMVTYTYDDSGKIIAYKAIIPERKIPGTKKYWKDMTEGEKKAALILMKTPGNNPYVPAEIIVAGTRYGLNEALWYSKGIIVYGSSFGGTSSSGPRYWGYDLNGGYYGNDSFPRDSDSGRAAWEKDWWTTVEIRDSADAKRLVGAHALTDAFRYSDKLQTAKAFLKENPAWRSHGLDENYILSHFFFNSVINDSGLTGGQFIGVQKNAGQLWYQVFSVEGTVQMFSIAPAEIVEGEVILWKDEGSVEDTDPEPEPDPDPVPLPEQQTVEGTPILSLPLFTYEGHPAPAKDQSLYMVDGEIWSAYRTLKAGLTSNRFALLEKDSGTLVQKTVLEAEASFDRAGTYDVRLRIAPKGGEYLYDVKSIEVGKTPTILHSLTGTKKENRKQILNLSVATHPKAMMTDFWVELESLDTGEKVRLHHDPAKPQNNHKNNGETIKTRAIEALASDSYFTNCRLEFLTKNSDWENFRYTVYVKDSRGKVEQVSADFITAPDLPPVAAIDLEKVFIRVQGTDLAEVEASDVSTSDGDQVIRSWSLCLAEPGTLPGDWPEEQRSFAPLKDARGFQDISMEKGRAQRVAFEKEGVGAFALRLDVKELWTEETLEEYISEEDYRRDSVVAESLVINIAPVVSLKPISSQKAEVLMLAADDSDYAALKEAAATLKSAFLEKAIDGEITVKQITPEASELAAGEEQVPIPVEAVREPFGYQGSWSFLGGGCYMVDEHRIYTIQATWKGTGLNDYPQSPYIITAYDGATGKTAWTFSLADNMMTVNNAGEWHRDSSRFAVDEEGEYLFFRNGNGKTLILSAVTGAYQTILNFEVGDYNCSGREAIYSFKDDGIYRISTKGQGVRQIYRGAISVEGACKQAGKVHFLLRQGAYLYRGLFNPRGEKIALERLTGEQGADYRTEFTLLGVDSGGTMILHKFFDDGNTAAAAMEVFGRDNALCRKVTVPSENASINFKADMWEPVYNENGRCNYVAYVREGHNSGSTNYHNYAEIYHSSDNSGALDIATSISNKNGHATNARIIYADQFGGKVYICTGGIRTYVYDYGYGGYTEKANTFIFDTASGAVTRTASGLAFGNDGEYGRASANHAAIHTDDNHTTQINGSKTVFLTWRQNADQILARYINKYSSGEGDRRYVIVYDSTGGLTVAADLPLTGQALQAGKAQAVYLDQLREGLADLLLEQETSDNVLAIKTDQVSQGGSLSFDFALDPAKEYFYEYEWRRGKEADGEEFAGIDADANPLIDKVLSDGELGDSAYCVREVITEDFEDQILNPFFQLTPAKVLYGKYWAGNPGLIGSSSSSSRTDTDTVRFTVPDGKKAVLSFDYDLKFYGLGKEWTENYVSINGVQWDIFQSGNRMTGTYTAKAFLPEGENVLSFRCAYYGKKENAPHLIIDNLTVSYVERESAGGGPGAAGDGSATGGTVENTGRTTHVASGGGWTKAGGSFDTPAGAAAYQSMPAVYFSGTLAQAKTAGYITQQGTKSPYIYTINVPQEKTAVRVGLKTSSGSSASNYEPSFAWATYKWINYYRSSGNGGLGNDIQSPFDLWLPKNLTGSQQIIATVPKNTWASITTAEMLLVDKTNRLLDQDRYFIGEEGLPYLENQKYSGKTKFTFYVPSEENIFYIKNLRIYTWIGGVKTYVSGEDFSDSARLPAWNASNVVTSIVPDQLWDSEEDHGLIYRKGELVAYNIKYYDHECDPSKKSYWKYIHTPFNDGSHPEAAVILSENGDIVSMNGKILSSPIKRFEIDGKYTVEHWQEDDTSRRGGSGNSEDGSGDGTSAGYPSYDKLSNVEIFTFYVEGAASAPRITSIKTQPSPVKEGVAYTILVNVGDDEKDVLCLDTELYFGNKKIQMDRQKGIAVKGGIYPQLKIPASALPQVGTYEVICTVRDETGTGLGSHRFAVISEGKVSGMVNHTAEWDDNRKKYNLKRFDEEVNRTVNFAAYSKESSPRKRGVNVFWSGERFELSAATGGSPLSVTCQIVGQGYSTALTPSGKKDASGCTIYTGSLWNNAMINKWGRKVPEELTFRFTASYAGGAVKTDDVTVILDSLEDYWLLHRLW